MPRSDQMRVKQSYKVMRAGFGNSKRFHKTQVYHLVAYMKGDLVIKSTPLYPTVCIFCIETIEGHMKRMQLNAIILSGA